MRGVTKDVITNAFYLIFALGIAAAIYFFAAEIFGRGAATTIGAFEEGGCACIDAVANQEIACADQKVICSQCEKAPLPPFGCKDEQKIENFRTILPAPVKKIRVCTHSDGNPIIFVDDAVKGATEPGAEKCLDVEFSEARKFDKISVAAGIGKKVDRLTVYWEKIES